jgi:hypothetical protein
VKFTQFLIKHYKLKGEVYPVFNKALCHRDIESRGMAPPFLILAQIVNFMLWQLNGLEKDPCEPIP